MTELAQFTLGDCTKALGDVEARFDALVYRILERKVSELQSKDAARDLEGYPRTSAAPFAAGVRSA